MADPITIETVIAGRLRDAGHLNYGRRGGGTIWQHTTIPRLSAIDRPTLSDEETKRLGVSRLREWSVDGGKSGSLEDAIAALNVPPVFTDEEREVLERVPAEWVELHEFRTGLAEELGRQVGLTIMTLRQKGAVENELRPGPDRRQPWIRRAPIEGGADVG
ncbi:hypothetical protein [Methylorubrum rhodesianum]|uniref:hypothetical protein n=1 Tax=Methylorubrum rhodesianum TaxID=29427 RepID=UPI0037469B97